MREPNEKEVGSFGNELLRDAVQMKLRWYHRTTVLANALGMPLSGVAYCVTDDEDCYNDTFDSRVKCLFHRLRTRARSDERVDTLAEEGRREELETYLENEYTDLYEEEVADLKDEYPFFWEEETEEFTGPVTTNAIEGGNWRLKEKLSVPYQRPIGTWEVLLSVLNGSLAVYSNGHPAASFAHHHGSFSFEKIMGRDSSSPDPASHPPMPLVRTVAM